VSTQDDQARAIAERVARRLGGDRSERVASSSIAKTEPAGTPEWPRARIIDFVASGPPLRSVSSVTRPSPAANTSEPARSTQQTEFFQFVPVTQSPWLGRLPSLLANQNPHTHDHSSEERFGVEEATVAELVEFFESEKKCSMDPSGKPCDHCAMCSSRGF
jgi:hypothetical protein